MDWSSILTSDMVKGWGMALARHALTSTGVYMVAHGYLASSQTNDWIGSGLFFAGVAWSVGQELVHQTRRPDLTTGK